MEKLKRETSNLTWKFVVFSREKFSETNVSPIILNCC